MPKEILSECCCGNIKKSSCKIENDLCPVCRKQGIHVKNFTVRHMILSEFMEKVGDNDYHLCMNEECDVTYYNSETNIQFNKQQVKVPIWFKKDASPKYVCYCSKVREEQIIDAILKDGATNMQEVLKITGAMSNPQCEKNNPLGKCCHKIIQEAIDKALSMK